MKEVAEETVRHETIGKWDRPAKPTELGRKSGGYLLDYEQQSPGKGKVAFAYPLHNPDLKDSAFAHIWVDAAPETAPGTANARARSRPGPRAAIPEGLSMLMGFFRQESWNRGGPTECFS